MLTKSVIPGIDTDDIEFYAHIHQTVVRAFVIANLIHKCFVSRDIFTLIRTNKVYVRPIVEYASFVWSPYHVSKTKQIEFVQWCFTKRLPGCALLSYEARLSRLGLESLEMRRLKYDFLHTWKIIFGIISDAAMNIFTLTSTLYSTSTRGHAYQLYPHNNRIDSRKHFFSERVRLLHRGTIYRLQPIIPALSRRSSDFWILLT